MSDDLLEHVRYPEDLFQVQRYQFARYHVTDPGDFYQGNNRWEVPEDPYTPGTFQPPYRLFVDAAESGGTTDAGQVFSLSSVYVPYNKNNLASFVSVDADATSTGYGKMRVLELTNEQTPGPGLVANQFASDPTVADLLAQFNRSGAKPVYGNLLTLPINDGLMYVQPVYATRVSDSSFPILRYVLVKYGNDVGVGSTLRGALADLLGTSSGSVTEPGDGGVEEPATGSVDSQIQQKLAGAEKAFNDAQAALEDNDLGEYQKQVDRAEQLVSDAVKLAEQRDDAEKAPDSSPSADPSESASPSS
jgi:uncharacterized membrane protein (UPF0182 family)